MLLKITIAVLFTFAHLACSDDVRIKVVGKSSASEEFQIDSTANLVTRETYTLTWSENPAAKSYDVVIAKDLSCSEVIFKKEGLSENRLVLDTLADGHYFLCVFAVLKTQTLPATNNGVPLTIDTTNPLVVVPVDTQVYSNTFDPDLKIEDSSKVTVSWSQVSGMGTIDFTDRNSQWPKLKADKDGIYKIKATITDQAGNSVEQIYQFSWDQIGPSVVLGPSYATAAPRAFAATVDATAVSYAWSYAGGPAGGVVSFSDPTAKAPLISTNLEGTYQITLRAKDSAGNEGSDTESFTWDQTPPSFTQALLSGPSSDGFLNAQDRLSTASILGSITADGYAEIGYKAVTAGTACTAALSYSSVSPKGNSTAFAVDGPYKVCLKFTDEAGLTSFGSSPLVTVDTLPATVNSIALAGPALDSVISVSEHAQNQDLVSTLIANDAFIAGYSLVSAGTACSGPLSYSAAVPKSNDTRFVATGDYQVCVRVRDEALNDFAFGQSATISFSAAAPTFFSLAKTGAGSDGYVNDGEKAGVTALWTLNHSGATVIAYTAPLDDTGGALACDASQTYSLATVARAADLTADGPWNICVRLRDAAGNTTYGKGEVISRDTLLPTLVSLNGANAASDGFIKDIEKASTDAAWALSASGQASASYTLPLDDTGGVLSCNGTQTYGQTAIPTIAGVSSDGARAICVLLTDAAGNINHGKSQQLVRDTQVPVFTSLLGANEASDGTIAATEAASTAALLTLSASGYDSIAYTLALDDTPAVSCDGTQTYGQSVIPAINALGADETYAVCLRLSDTAGNITYGKSQSITKMTGPPTFSSLARTAEGADGSINDSEKSATNPIWSLSASGAASSAYTVPLNDAGAAVVCDAAQTYNQGAIAAAVDLPSDAIWIICVRLDNGVGTYTYGKSQQITRDIIAPSFSSLALANAAVGGYINDSEKLLTSTLWTLSASGQSSTDYSAALDDTGGAQICDGSDTYNQASIARPSDLASDGAYALCVRLTDAAGNISYGKSAQVVRDIVAPTFSSLNGANGAADLIIKSGEQTSALSLFTLVASGHSAADFTLALSDDPAAITCDSGQTYGQASIPLINSIASDGKYAICIRLDDAAGNRIYGKSQQVERDTQAPALTSLNGANEASDGYIRDSEKASNSSAWALVASGQSATAYTLPLDDSGGAVVCNVGQTYGQSAIALVSSIASDDTWAICVRLTDTAGNITYGKSQSIIRDTALPTMTSFNGANEASDGYINAAEAASTSDLLTLVASGQTTTAYTLALDDTPAITCDVTQTYSEAQVPPIDDLAGDESYTVCVRLTDAAGNITYGKSQTIVKDTSTPSFTSLVRAAEGADSYINDSEKAATNALWTLSASGASATAYTVALDDTGGALGCNGGQTYNQGTTVAYASNLTSDGPWSICVRLSDAAGNLTYGKGEQIIRDITPPAFTSLLGANAASNGFINDSEKALVTALWTLSASGHAAAAYTLALDDTGGAVSCNVGQTYDQASIPIPTALAADSPYALCVRLTDTAGNINYGKSQQIIRDIALPSFTSLVAANEASDHIISNGEQNSTGALYTLSATGHSAAAYTVPLDDTAGALTCDVAKTYNQGSIPTIVSIGLDGTYALCARLTDAAGNIAYGKSQQIVRNVGGPSFTSLLAANGASDGYINDAEKASTALAWTLNAASYTGVTYTLPLDDTGAALTCDASETYGQGTIPQIDAITSDGAWAICARLIDGASNITYGKSQQIVRDIVAPSFTNLNGANEASNAYINAAEAASALSLLTLSATGYDALNYTVALDDTGGSVTCNVGQTYDQAGVPLISDLASDGPWAVCARLSDSAGNISYGKSQQIVRDVAAPSFTSLVRAAEGADSYINDSEKAAADALWTLSASGQSVTDYTVALDDTGGTLSCNSGKTYNQGTTVATAASIATDGPWSLCVRLSDAAGNITYGKGEQITRDIAAPSLTSLARANAASDGYINDSEKLLVSTLWSLTASGQSSTLYTSALDDSGGSVSCDGGKTYDQATIARPSDLGSDGLYALCVRLADAAGNITFGKSAQITRDVAAPSLTSLNGANEASDLYIKSGEENAGNALYALTASGHDSDDFTAALDDTGGALTCDSGKTYGQATIPLISSIGSDGVYALCVRLMDNAGNTTYGKSQSVTRDLIAPTMTSLNRANDASDGYITDAEKASTAAAWALVASGHADADYTVPLDDAGAAVSCDAGKTYNQSTIPQVDAIISDGTWAICVQLTDAAGNIAYGKSQQVIRDISLPVFTSLNGANGASDGYVNGSEAASALALLTLSASGQTATAYTLALDDSTPVTCNGGQTYGQGSVPNIDALGADGPYAVCVRLSDAAGNITYGKSQVITKDTGAPSVTSLARTAEGSDGYINDTEKAATDPLWTLSASGHTAVTYTVALDDTAGAQVCNVSDTYDQGTSIPGASGLASDGAWTLCARLSDAAGNITYGKGQQITRDTIAPAFTSLALTNAASDGYINDSEKLLTSTLWSLSASGQTVTDYSTALDDTGGALNCNASPTYNQSTIARPADLGSDGPYALCVRLSDAAGNITYGKSAQVIRDVVAPVFGSLAGANEASDGYIKSGEEAATNALYAIAGSSGYTVDDFTAALDDSGGITCNSGQTYSSASIPLINTVTPDGTYAVCAKLADAAGNTTYGKSAQVVRDIVAPTFTSLNAASVAADGYIAYGERNSATAAWTLSASGQTATDYTVALDDTGAAVACDSGKTYGSGSIPLISSITSDGPWAACVRLTDAAGNIAYGKSEQIIRQTVAPGTPSAFTATAGNAYIDLKWTASTGTPAGYVLVRGPAGSAPTFVPSDGTTYSLGAQGSDQIISIGAATLMMDSPLNIGTSYSYKVYAYDAALSYSAAASASVMPITPCASNYVFVAGDPDYGTTDFCVMKYEAKDVGGFATSQAASTPWVSISQQNSITKCAANGLAYHLINNNEWMTIGSHVAALGSNWTGGTVGSGNLFAGHNDNNPTSACAASSDDTLFYVETNCTPVSTGDSAEQRRTLTLSNSSAIWDLSGNAWEWVNYINAGDKPGATAAWYEYTAVTGTTTTALKDLVPTNAVKAFWSDAWNSGNRIGQYFPGTNGSGGALVRGGYHNDGSYAGVFHSYWGAVPTHSNTDGGFRCIQKLPDLDAPILALAASSSQITATWTTVGGATGYILVRGAAGSLPTFQPVNGTTYSAGSQGSDQIVYAGTALTYSDTNLDNNREYNYALYSYTAGPVYSSPARSKDTPLACPTGFVLVPGDTDYGTDDFCVMKYEAKNIGSVSASRPENVPWMSISQQDALTACTALGSSYQLISNSEWMTVAANAAYLGSNWSSGTRGTGNLFMGHGDTDPSAACQASNSDSYAYVENNCIPKASGQGEDSESTQRRTLNLSNGGVVWDLSGNAGEYVNAININDKPGATAAWYEYTAITGTTSTPLKSLIPTNAVKSWWVDTWNSTQKIGKVYPGTNGTTGAFQRGGYWTTITGIGLFSTHMNNDPTQAAPGTGFRCVSHGFTEHTPLNFVATPHTNSVSLSWEKGGSTTAGYLLVRGQAGKLPLFQPADGTTYTTGAQGNDTVIFVGNSIAKLDSGLTTGGNYHYRLFGYDSAKNYSSAAVQSVNVTPCAENWVFVPGDSDYKTNDFCVMKYEAKSDGATIPMPLAQASSTPWVSITHNDSITKCSALGSGYHLINNLEWMTIGANIAARSSNWTGGGVGSGTLIAGHNDNDPAAICAASSNDDLSYVETSCTPVSTGDTSDQRRTLSLSTSEVIWDLPGNVFEFVNYFNSTAKPGATDALYEYSALSGTTTTPLKYLVPTNAVKSFWSNSWNSTQRIGKFYPGVNASGGILMRGGDYNDGLSGGMFRAHLTQVATASAVDFGFRCVQGLPDLDEVKLTLTPSTTAITATWASTGASGYMLVRGPANTEPTFAPVDGMSYSTGVQGSDTILYLGSSLSYDNTSLTTGSTYYYALYSYDANDSYLLIARDHETPITCPTGFVLVPGDKDYSTQDFCVMKYEAKNNGSNVAVSQAAGTPWTSITQHNSKTECTAMGQGYDLISNAQWMTLGANAAAGNGNWTGGTVGSGDLFAGHNDESPKEDCAASSNDTLFYVESNCTPVSSGDTAEQRRTHTLSNGTVIWDISGNSQEWVNYFNSSDKPGATAAWYEYTAVSNSSSMALRDLIPTNAIKNSWSDTWNSGQWIGRIYPGGNNGGGGLIRGGDNSDRSDAGVFAARLSISPTTTGSTTSFRCTTNP